MVKVNNKCIACEACVNICPFAAIEMTKTKEGKKQALIKQDLCVMCMTCVSICPVGAID